MTDDMDGVDWAESFSGPDDDEIERLREQEWQSSVEYETEGAGLEYARRRVGSAAQIQDSGYRYSSFDAASARAKQRHELGYPNYRVEAVEDGWVLKSQPVPEVGQLAEDHLDRESKLSLGIALFHALARKQREYARQLLERPLDVNVLGGTGSSPLMVAAQRGYSELCEKLLSLGATFQTEIEMPHDPNYDDTDEPAPRADTVMLRACLSQDWPTIEVITKVYVSAEWKWMRDCMPESDLPDWGYPRLVEAARYGMSSLCAEMIGCGVDVNRNISDFMVEKPIEAAFNNDQISTCFVLAAMGADISPVRGLDDFTGELATALLKASASSESKPSSP